MSNEKSETMHDLVIKPALTGVSGAVLSLGLVSSSTKMYGFSAPIVFGASLGAASLASGVLKETVYENFLSDDSAELIYAATTPILTGGVAVALYYTIVGTVSTKSAGSMFVLGALSEMAGTYIDDNMLGAAIDM